jgi:hypothetical protein
MRARGILVVLGVVGLAVAFGVAAPGPASANLVTNGGFETGDFSGWTVSGHDTGNMYVDDSDPHSGIYAANLGSVGGLGFLTQNLPTTAGQTYNLTYWLALDSECCPNEFQVSWNGTVLLDTQYDQGFSYQEFTFDNLLAPGSSTPLQFGAREDPEYFHLDDVSAVPSGVPEPGTFVLLGSVLPGLAGLAMRRRLRRASEPHGRAERRI